MSEWQPIETAPKNKSILLYWPKYAYNLGETPEPCMAIGRWKRNSRIKSDDPDAIGYGMQPAYFSDNWEYDDYGLAQDIHAPTHWMPLPEPPT